MKSQEPFLTRTEIVVLSIMFVLGTAELWACNMYILA